MSLVCVAAGLAGTVDGPVRYPRVTSLRKISPTKSRVRHRQLSWYLYIAVLLSRTRRRRRLDVDERRQGFVAPEEHIESGSSRLITTPRISEAESLPVIVTPRIFNDVSLVMPGSGAGGNLLLSHIAEYDFSGFGCVEG